MSIKKHGEYYFVESSKKGKFYRVTIEQPFCDCPDFIFRAVKGGPMCKHVKAVQEMLVK